MIDFPQQPTSNDDDDENFSVFGPPKMSPDESIEDVAQSLRRSVMYLFAPNAQLAAELLKARPATTPLTPLDDLVLAIVTRLELMPNFWATGGVSHISELDLLDVGATIRGDATNYTACLLRLVAKSDTQNRERLRLAFPRVVQAWENWVVRTSKEASNG